MAVVETPTSLSRRALGGHPIFNTGMLALRTRDPLVSLLMARWERFTWQASAAMLSGDTSHLPHAPFNLTAVELELLAANDQFGLALQLSAAEAVPELQMLSRVELPTRFNFRGRGHGVIDNIVVNHDSAYKERATREHLRQVNPGGHILILNRRRHQKTSVAHVRSRRLRDLNHRGA